MSQNLLRVAVRPDGVLWKNALAAYEKLTERRDWVRERVHSMVIEEEVSPSEEDTAWFLYLLAKPTDEDDSAARRYLAVFRVFGDPDKPAQLKLDA